MELIEIKAFISFTLTIVLLCIGKMLIAKSNLLQEYSIPEPVIGGFVCASIVAIFYYFFDLKITFDL